MAADLQFIVSDPLGFLADMLVTYDQVIVPIDARILLHLSARIPVTQIDRLLKEHRLVFCPAASRRFRMSTGAYREFGEFTRSMFLAHVHDELSSIEFDTQSHAKLMRQVEHHLLVGPQPDYHRWTAVLDVAVAAFNEVAGRSGYEWLYPIDPRFGVASLDRVVGLETGIARINDLVEVGVTDLELDAELPYLMSVCFPAQDLSAATKSRITDVGVRDLVRSLHRIENLPLLSEIARRESWSDERIIDTLLSDESARLREWLRVNVVPGIDVREAYTVATAKLPSKQNWNGWLRFGAVSAVSAAVAALVTGPTFGAVAGLAVGATDQAVGTKLQAWLSDPYHPKSWLSFLRR